MALGSGIRAIDPSNVEAHTPLVDRPLAESLSSEDETLARAGSPHSPTLAEEAQTFWSHRNPPLIAILLLIGMTLRISIGEWRWWDLGVVVIAIGIQPFVEWLIHVFVLHAKPLRVIGRSYDSMAARKHREHHADPRKIEWIFLPSPALAQLLLIVVGISFLVTSTTPLAMTALTWTLAMLLIYEWVHFLIHSRYKPKTRAYRYIWRSHRLHHFRNEHYWFGITSPTADIVLRTAPDKDAVATSTTCRTIGQTSVS